MKEFLQKFSTGALLLTSLTAHAQMAMPGPGIVVAAVVVFAVFGIVLWGLTLLALIYLLPRFRHQKQRPGIKKAALHALYLVLAVLAVLIAVSSINGDGHSHQETEIAIQLPPPNLIKTTGTGNAECHLKGCAIKRFLDPAGKPLIKIDYCVKDELGKIIARGITDHNGDATYVGNKPGEKVAIEVYWFEIEE
jgi:hypothetical protein